ncbi:MAG: PAS domain-containing protein [Planctomycetes bacterium]|nr:PAS domain-containing protein [Planctomycetota bacterium]
MRAAVDNAVTAIMMVDRDLNITYTNEASRKILRDNAAVLAKSFRGVDFTKDPLGQSIDLFHKDPSYQRGLLADPANLPHSADIQVADLRFRINATAIFDEAGEYVGNSLEWSDVTELRTKESEVARIRSAIDRSSSAIMMIDRDLEITYANDSTYRLVKENLPTFEDAFPKVDFGGDLVGVCIDVFHENPAYQRRLLADPANLPHTADIKIGDLRFQINVSPIIDETGSYVGNNLEWSNVTELRRQESEVARMMSALEGSQTALMMCNSDFEIVYMNPAVTRLLERRAEDVRKTFPGFNPSHLMGANIDQFHVNPKHQRTLLSDPANLPATSELKIGTTVFQVNATAILDAEGQLVGNCVEWVDLTEQKDAESQIRHLIQSAIEGNLDERLDTNRYQGFVRDIGNGINQLVDAVVKPIRAGSDVLEAFSKGDLTQEMQGDYQGEFAKLRDVLNSSIGNISDIVSRIRDAAGHVGSGADEIAKGNTELSSRAEEQASSVQETVASIEEMTGTVKQNADNSREADQLAKQARDLAETGGQVVSAAVEAMGGINSASKKIADIIGVIDEIAFQTNLLALNAAVEAARAGEQGRGFAVVAAEVRNLAQRSAEAAKEIKSLINDSVEQVEEGSKLVDDSGAKLEEIVTSVKKVSEIISEIAAASEEQSAGVEQINKAMNQIDEVTQQNAALVEEAAAAAASLNDQSRSLEELMGFFRVAEEEAAAPAPRREARAPRSRPEKRPNYAPQAPASSDDDWDEF